MGITGLIPLLKEAQTVTHISDYAGQTLAVDAYVWLHRGAYSCAQELGTGQPTLKYCNYALEKIRMLQHFKVTPYIVFDGAALPSKLGTEKEREKRRNDALAKGNECLAAGNSAMARDHFVKAVDITPEMAYQLIKALKKENVKYVVAPYEADPQLAYLERIGLVDGVITEDSDLLVFGCKKILFKLDKDGSCLEIKRENFSLCREINLTGWTIKEFRQMAILSGCDYLDSINGIGLKKAYNLMRKFKTAEKSIQSIRLDGKYTVPQNYVQEFKRAELTFCHQRVFDPRTQDMVYLEPIPPGVTEQELSFVGALMETEYARGVASGSINPLSKLPVIDISPKSFTEADSTTKSSFYRAPKAKVAVATKGAGSILNFFTKSQVPLPTPAPTASTSMLPSLPAFKPVTMIEAIKPAVKSKFFGGGDVKGKGKAAVVEDAEPTMAEMMEVEPQRSISPILEIGMEDSGFFDGELLVTRSPAPPSSLPCNISSPGITPPKALSNSRSKISEATTPTNPSRKVERSSISSHYHYSEAEDEIGEIEIAVVAQSEMEGISSPVEIIYAKEVMDSKPVLNAVTLIKSKIKLERKKGRMDSDPIDCDSSDKDEVDSIDSPEPVKQLKRSSGVLAGRVVKKMKVEMIVMEDVQEIKDEGRENVIAGWRQKFLPVAGIKKKNIQSSLAAAAKATFSLKPNPSKNPGTKVAAKASTKLSTKPKSTSQPTKKLPRSPSRKAVLIFSSPEKLVTTEKAEPSRLQSKLFQFQFKGFSN